MPETKPYRASVQRIRAEGGLDAALLERMAALYLAHYDGSSEALFCRDLREKDEVVLLYCAEELAGFSAFKCYTASWRGQPVRVVYSGDTVVARQHWGQQALAFAWITRMGEIRRQAPETPLYWFLLVKGHRTFKYLSVFGKSFFPHWQLQRPDLRALAEELASARFGKDYDPASGIVRFPDSRGRLRADIAAPRAEELAKPGTRFFLRKNPGYAQGDELVCLCELVSANMKPLAARLFEHAGSVRP
ncbi:MAG: hypothetical protein LBS49_07050 [Candidatus Accumulibacter sp.]|jgi:hypothetical protein|nr:hypothetical protein [Accumulibacter sp.]